MEGYLIAPSAFYTKPGAKETGQTLTLFHLSPPSPQQTNWEVTGRVAPGGRGRGSSWLAVLNWPNDLDWPLPPLPDELV